MKKTYGCRRSRDRIGVLIAQLGTPEAPTAQALRPYLRQFLGDPRIIEKNRLLWWVVLNALILPRRPARSARLYSRIWTTEGSPLMVHTTKQTELVRHELNQELPELVVEFGMRYGQPSIGKAIDKLIAEGVGRILLFPMYPQYSATTTGSTYDAVFDRLRLERFVPTLQIVPPYYRDRRYIAALAATINEGYQRLPNRPERLVLSYHGIPEAYVTKGDPYCCMCTETTESLKGQLQIPAAAVIHTYQSRFGKDPWLVPYTDETIKRLSGEGVKRIAVACPGFTADCLETLDELGHEGRELFEAGGGEEYSLIPCLNEHPLWINAMKSIILDSLRGWTDSQDLDATCAECPVELAKRSAQ